MDFNRFFRGFFGDGRGFGMNFGNEFDDPEDDQEDDVEDDSFHHIFHNPYENFEDPSMHIFRQMEDMFSKMFSDSFGFMNTFPKFDVPSESNPRNFMLKDPDIFKRDCPPCKDANEESDPTKFADTDIDDKIGKGLFSLKEFNEIQTPRKFSYKKFSSYRTVRLPDGTFEEHQTFTDSDGNTVTKVKRSIGDQSHEVITHSDNEGVKEKEENLINIDEGDLSEFENKWKSKKHSSHPVPENLIIKPGSRESTLSIPSGDPSYLSLFKKFFSLDSDKK